MPASRTPLHTRLSRNAHRRAYTRVRQPGNESQGKQCLPHRHPGEQCRSPRAAAAVTVADVLVFSGMRLARSISVRKGENAMTRPLTTAVTFSERSVLTPTAGFIASVTEP